MKLLRSPTVDTLSPLVAMHILDISRMIVGIFLKSLRSPTVVSDPGLCVDVLCTSRTQRVVRDNCHTAYHQRLTLIWRYCWMKRPGPTIHDRVRETGSTDMLLQIGGWRVSVSPTLVESSLATAGPC